MATKFTDQQQSVIDNRGGDLLVSAAAGSGKTTVLVERIMQYLLDSQDPANLDDFLMITYTKAAAAELRGKIAARLTVYISEHPENKHLRRQLQRLYLAGISTVHAFCGDLLRQYAYRVDVPMDFRVADENECYALRMEVAEKVLEDAYQHADEDFTAFSDTQAMGRTDSTVPEIVLKIYEASRCHLNPDAWLEECLQNSTQMGNEDYIHSPWGAYLAQRMQGMLSKQIPVVERYAALAEEIPEYAKPAMVLRDELKKLLKLQESTSWDEYVENAKITFDRLTFPKKDPNPDVSEQIRALRNAMKERIGQYGAFFTETSEQIREDTDKLQSATRGLIALVREFAKRFDEAKKKRRILDFSDLEHRTLDLLRGKKRDGVTRLAREIGSRYREILVDEYQDSNQVQDGIFTALTQEKHDLFMVGDVKQSIYRFRLADPNIFLNKYNSYIPAQEAESDEERKIVLSRNFRSGTGVVNAVNDVFSYCMSEEVGDLEYGEDEALVEGVPHIPLPDAEVELYCLETEDDAYAKEAAFTAGRIAQLLDGEHYIRDGENLRPIKPEDIAILLRSPRNMASYYQEALRKYGIRSDAGDGADLLKTEEISAVRALLQCISNPRQDIALLGALTSPLFGFTADDLAEIRKGKKDISFYDAMVESELSKAQRFVESVKELRKKARMLRLSDLLAEIYTDFQPENLFRLRDGGEVRQGNLQAFYQVVVDYENGGRRDLDQFLAYLDLMEEKGLKPDSSGAGSDCVTIKSIHKSKGLEYPVVFLCGLSKLFNRDSSRGRVLCDKELGIGLSVMDEKNRFLYPSIAKQAIAVKERQESLSEELRVLYVAMTRAKDRLIMTFTKKNPGKYFSDLLSRMDLEHPILLSQSVSNMGDWVMLAALQHTEAGDFFAFGNKHHTTALGSPMWKIAAVQDILDAVSDGKAEERTTVTMPDGAIERLKESLNFTYAHDAATRVPSKRTATELKGRHKDEEAASQAENTFRIQAQWRKNLKDKLSGKERGNAVHKAMQFLNFADCETVDAIEGQLLSLRDRGILSQEQKDSITASQISAFFSTSVGRELMTAKEVIREFKFSLLEDGEKYDPALAGEKILLQGVVDCAIIEDDGIILVDFKTDRVRDLAEKVDHYSPQVNTYAVALSKIYELPVKEKYLYFFQSGDLAEVK